MSEEFSPGMYSDPDLSMKLWQEGVRYFKGIGCKQGLSFRKQKHTKTRKEHWSSDLSQ